MLFKDGQIWNNLKSVLHRVGSFFYRHFKHVTAGIRTVADKVHSMNVGPISSLAGLVSRGSTVADRLYDFGHEITGIDPPKESTEPPPWA